MKWILWGLLFIFSFWLMFHTFSYDGKEHAMLISTKAWSDFGQHIPMIRSFSFGDNWPPEHPLYPGEPIHYHFLFYAFVGLLEKLGIRIDWAINFPSALGFFLLLLMIFLVSKELFQKSVIGALTIIFFLFNGSLSFLRFFEKHSLSTNILNDIVTNSVFPSFAPWGPGDISAFWNLNIYTNQRHLGLAFGIALLIIYLFLKLEKRPLTKQLPWVIPTSMILGIYPYFHQPTLLILAIFMVVYFVVFSRLRIFLLLTGLLSLIFILPQLSLLSHGPKLLAWYPGYLIHDSLSPVRFVGYWWQNLGLHSILILLGFFLIPKRARRALLPIFFIFIVANLFKFSVEVAASHKLFNFALIVGNMVSAYMLIKLFSFFRIRLFAYLFIGLLIVFLTLSGVIDFFAVYNDPKGVVKDIPADETATWILKNTPRDAVFLNSSFFYHPASIAGRKIYLGWPYFAWSEGYDSNMRLKDLKEIYESNNLNFVCHQLARFNIDYITLDSREKMSEVSPNVPFLEKNFRKIFVSGDKTYTIYQPPKNCL